MKIVHLCLQAVYNDYWGYQDNLLPKYHRKQGHEVTIITNTQTFDENKKIVEIEEQQYTLKDGQRIIRINCKKFKNKKIEQVLSYFKIYELLNEIKPDYIMVHGLTNFSVLQVAKYKKRNKNCNIVADTHLDYYNTKTAGGSFLYKIYLFLLKQLNHYMQKYYSKIYGVTPWRMKFANDVLGIDNNKLDLLVMGGDTEEINFNDQDKIKQNIRKKYSISIDDFLIITGGKIDKTKNIHLLMGAVNEISDKDIKLIFFGKPDGEMKEKIKKFSESEKIIDIGWIESEGVYDYFLASDLAIFPGTHSVLWEQACSCGLPLIVKWWEGMQHVDVGGNCRFLENDTVQEIKKEILEVYNKEEYEKMKKVAIEKGINIFSYENIAKKALEIMNKERK